MEQEVKFNEVQQYEIDTGLEQGLDVSIYAKPEFSFLDMYIIRKGLERGYDVSYYATQDFTLTKKLIIFDAMEHGIMPYVIAKKQFRAGRMHSLLLELIQVKQFIDKVVADYRGEMEKELLRKILLSFFLDNSTQRLKIITNILKRCDTSKRINVNFFRYKEIDKLVQYIAKRYRTDLGTIYYFLFLFRDDRISKIIKKMEGWKGGEVDK